MRARARGPIPRDSAQRRVGHGRRAALRLGSRVATPIGVDRLTAAGRQTWYIVPGLLWRCVFLQQSTAARARRNSGTIAELPSQGWESSRTAMTTSTRRAKTMPSTAGLGGSARGKATSSSARWAPAATHQCCHVRQHRSPACAAALSPAPLRRTFPVSKRFGRKVHAPNPVTLLDDLASYSNMASIVHPSCSCYHIILRPVTRRAGRRWIVSL